MKPLFEIIIEGFRLIPYVRMTRRGKWVNSRAKEYLDNQEQLAWLFKKKWGQSEPIPENVPLEISFSVHYRDKRVRDSDNCDKAIRDALQKSGIIRNDRQIRGTGITRVWNDGVDRVVVSLKRL